MEIKTGLNLVARASRVCSVEEKVDRICCTDSTMVGFVDSRICWTVCCGWAAAAGGGAATSRCWGSLLLLGRLSPRGWGAVEAIRRDLWVLEFGVPTYESTIRTGERLIRLLCVNNQRIRLNGFF